MAPPPPGQAQQAEHVVDVAPSPGLQPLPRIPVQRIAVARLDLCRQALTQQHPVAGRGKSGLGQALVGQHEVEPQQAVPIDKDQQISPGFTNGTVSRRTEPKTLVGLPAMQQPFTQVLAPARHHLDGLRSRTVIGHQDLQWHFLLARDAGQHPVQRTRPVVGGDDQRNRQSAFTARRRRALQVMVHYVSVPPACRRAYSPPNSISSACVPDSTMRPSSSTRMRSAFSMVESRCAMISVV